MEEERKNEKQSSTPSESPEQGLHNPSASEAEHPYGVIIDFDENFLVANMQSKGFQHSAHIRMALMEAVFYLFGSDTMRSVGQWLGEQEQAARKASQKRIVTPGELRRGRR